MGASDLPHLECVDASRLVLTALLDGLRAPARVSVSEWADRHRRLPTKGAAEPGQWRTDRVPYLREIMDTLSPEHPARRVVFKKSVQSGGTEAGLNWVGWFIGTQRAPMMVVQPTLDLAEVFSQQRLASMIDDTPTLRAMIRPARERDSGNRTLLKEFPGGVLRLAGANSGAGLRSMPVRYLMLDEVDAYPVELEGEGDPIKLAEARTTTFARRKVFLISTPTVESLSRIEPEWQASDQRHYHVPCPHCGTLQPLVWDRLQWEPRQPATARYACAECGGLAEEAHKPAMLAGGRWVPTHPDRPVVGYHINALYTPIGLGLSWAELAAEHEAAREDARKLKAFTNLRLGDVTRDPNEKLDWEELRDRAEPAWSARSIPAGVYCLTAGIDVQKDRWAVAILGWARHFLAVVEWYELPGDPTVQAEWDRLEDHVARQTFASAAGVPMRVELAAVDSGYLQNDVLAFTRPRQRRGWMAVKGSGTDTRRPIITRPSRVDFTWRGQVLKGGAEQWPVGVYDAKEMLFSRLAKDRDRAADARAIRFPDGLPDAFYSQLTAEVYDSVKRRFVPIRPRNEALDTVVYALAAGHNPRQWRRPIPRWDESDWARREAVYAPLHGDLFSAPAVPAEPDTPPTEHHPTPSAPVPAPPRPRSGWVNSWK